MGLLSGFVSGVADAGVQHFDGIIEERRRARLAAIDDARWEERQGAINAREDFKHSRGRDEGVADLLDSRKHTAGLLSDKHIREDKNYTRNTDMEQFLYERGREDKLTDAKTALSNQYDLVNHKQGLKNKSSNNIVGLKFDSFKSQNPDGTSSQIYFNKDIGVTIDPSGKRVDGDPADPFIQEQAQAMIDKESGFLGGYKPEKFEGRSEDEQRSIFAVKLARQQAQAQYPNTFRSEQEIMAHFSNSATQGGQPQQIIDHVVKAEEAIPASKTEETVTPKRAPRRSSYMTGATSERGESIAIKQEFAAALGGRGRDSRRMPIAELEATLSNLLNRARKARNGALASNIQDEMEKLGIYN